MACQLLLTELAEIAAIITAFRAASCAQAAPFLRVGLGRPAVERSSARTEDTEKIASSHRARTAASVRGELQFELASPSWVAWLRVINSARGFRQFSDTIFDCV